MCLSDRERDCQRFYFDEGLFIVISFYYIMTFDILNSCTFAVICLTVTYFVMIYILLLDRSEGSPAVTGRLFSSFFHSCMLHLNKLIDIVFYYSLFIPLTLFTIFTNNQWQSQI